MELLKQLIKYLKTNHLWVKLKYGNNQDFQPKDFTDPLVKELKVLQGKETPTAYRITNPQDITTPLERAIQSIPSPKIPEPLPFPTDTAINNPEAITEPLSEALKSLETAIRDGREVVVENDLSPLLEALKASKDKGEVVEVLKEIRDKAQAEQVNYTPILSSLIEAVEAKTVDLSKVEKLLAKLDKKSPEYFKLDKGQLAQLIPISMMHAKHLNVAGTQVNPATEEKQDSIIAAIEAITPTDVSALATEAKQDAIIAALPTGYATEAKQNDIITSVDNQGYPAGSGSNGSVTLTLASTAYAVPATASTKNHLLVLYNGSDTDMYWGFATLTSGGILLPSGGTTTVDLGANQTLFAYCASTGKVVSYSYKEQS